MTGRDIRTVAGFLIILLGVLASIWLGWWLSTEGDVIELIHRLKLGLPGWAWLALRVALSAALGVLFLSFFVLIAAVVFRGRGK